MDQSVAEFWNKRFAEPGHAYGKSPNSFFKAIIDMLPPGRIFVPGAGQGRDAVYAAVKGWDVYCADLSWSGKEKALELAMENNVSLNYEVINITNAHFPDNYFDVVASVFFHLPGAARRSFYDNMVKWLKPEGLFIQELFSPAQLSNTSGGPKDADMLVTPEILATELVKLEIEKNEEAEIILNEGKYHQGKANVVRFVGRKRK